MPSFDDFSLQPATCAVLAKMEITEPTPIQAQAIPVLLAGHDLVGQSATGSGKTLAYSIPLIERLSREKRVVQALVLVPTRELAVQVNTVLSKLATSRRLTTALLVGGRPYGTQISALRYGAQIVVGTPGRVKDHIDRGSLVLSELRICVLDEADQMLDIGFAPMIEEILTTTPDTRQMALFSATMPEWVEKLQKKFLQEPVKVDITPALGAQSTIEQIAYKVSQEQKMAALCTLLNSAEGESSLIFGRTKFGVEKLGKQLSKLGFTVGTLHGDKSQRAREEVLTAFRRGQVQTLLATNVAARGLDIKGIYQVINYELPESTELFTHRIGRTGRMGQPGKAITLLAPSDVSKWRRMTRGLGPMVALQKMVIEEETVMAIPFTRPQMALSTEYEEVVESRPAPGRRSFSRPQGRGRFSRSESTFERRNGEEHEQRGRRDRRPFAGDGEREKPLRSASIATIEQEQSASEFRPARNRRSFAGDTEHGKSTRSGATDGHAAAGLKRRSKSVSFEDATEWQPEGALASERPFVSRGRDGRKTTDKARGRRETQAFITTEAQYETGRNKSRAKTAVRGRRAGATNRPGR